MIKEPTKNPSKYGLNARPFSKGGIKKTVINITTQKKTSKNKTANSSVVSNSIANDTDTTTSFSPENIHSEPKSTDQILVALTSPHRPVKKKKQGKKTFVNTNTKYKCKLNKECMK